MGVLVQDKVEMFETFFSNFPRIKTIFFNGKDASIFFNDFRSESTIFHERVFITLQSTSPSNKTNSFYILKEWMQIRSFIKPDFN